MVVTINGVQQGTLKQQLASAKAKASAKRQQALEAGVGTEGFDSFVGSLTPQQARDVYGIDYGVYRRADPLKRRELVANAVRLQKTTQTASSNPQATTEATVTTVEPYITYAARTQAETGVVPAFSDYNAQAGKLLNYSPNTPSAPKQELNYTPAPKDKPVVNQGFQDLGKMYDAGERAIDKSAAFVNKKIDEATALKEPTRPVQAGFSNPVVLKGTTLAIKDLAKGALNVAFTPSTVAYSPEYANSLLPQNAIPQGLKNLGRGAYDTIVSGSGEERVALAINTVLIVLGGAEALARPSSGFAKAGRPKSLEVSVPKSAIEAVGKTPLEDLGAVGYKPPNPIITYEQPISVLKDPGALVGKKVKTTIQSEGGITTVTEVSGKTAFQIVKEQGKSTGIQTEFKLNKNGEFVPTGKVKNVENFSPPAEVRVGAPEIQPNAAINSLTAIESANVVQSPNLATISYPVEVLTGNNALFRSGYRGTLEINQAQVVRSNIQGMGTLTEIDVLTNPFTRDIDNAFNTRPITSEFSKGDLLTGDVNILRGAEATISYNPVEIGFAGVPKTVQIVDLPPQTVKTFFEQSGSGSLEKFSALNIQPVFEVQNPFAFRGGRLGKRGSASTGDLLDSVSFDFKNVETDFLKVNKESLRPSTQFEGVELPSSRLGFDVDTFGRTRGRVGALSLPRDIAQSVSPPLPTVQNNPLPQLESVSFPQVETDFTSISVALTGIGSTTSSPSSSTALRLVENIVPAGPAPRLPTVDFAVAEGGFPGGFLVSPSPKGGYYDPYSSKPLKGRKGRRTKSLFGSLFDLPTLGDIDQTGLLVR